MASETKIGLLVGLAFIVCFGVVLSHRGSGDKMSTEVAMELLKRHQEPPAEDRSQPVPTYTRRHPGGGRSTSAPAAAPGAAERSTVEHGGSPVTSDRPAVPISSVPGHRRMASGEVTPASGAGSGRPAFEALFGPDESSHSGAVEPSRSAEVADAPHHQTPEHVAVSPPPAAAARGTHPAPANSVVGHAPAERAAERRLPGAASPSSQDPVQPSPPVRPPTQGAPLHRPKPLPSEPRQYVVKSGDTLWHIAEQQYGQASRALVDALYAANRDRMSSPDALAAGMTLTLPERASESPAAPTGKQAAAKTKAEPRSEEPVRTYQVQGGDRYTTIAERFLGDKGRWKEIYELNKDIFPDAGKIRPGVRIRLPATVLADAR